MARAEILILSSIRRSCGFNGTRKIKNTRAHRRATRDCYISRFARFNDFSLPNRSKNIHNIDLEMKKDYIPVIFFYIVI